MPMAITAAPAAPKIPPVAASAKVAANPAQPSTASAAASRSHQQAAISQMLVKYAYDQSHGSDARTLSALGKQITTAARTLGIHVTLPQAPATAASAAPEPSAPPTEGKLRVTA